MGARYYGSSMGRFMTPDWSAVPVPVPYADMSDPQTLNLYGYVRNNPLSHADADGHCCAPSELADYIDTQVQTFRQDGLSVNNNASPAMAAINTFANGVTGDIASGTADLLRVGNGTAAAIDSAKQGDYLGAAANLSQDGGRVGGIIMIVAGCPTRLWVPHSLRVFCAGCPTGCNALTEGCPIHFAFFAKCVGKRERRPTPKNKPHDSRQPTHRAKKKNPAMYGAPLCRSITG